MRLASLPHRLLPTAHILTELEEIGIKTVADLLFAKVPLDIYQALSHETSSLNDLMQYIDAVAETSSVPGIPAATLFMHAKRTSDPPCAGDQVFDDLLRGYAGYETIEITGGPRSGKSTLALNLIIKCLLEHPAAVATWFDTTGNFSVERASIVLKSLSSSAADTANVLERLQVSQTFDIDDVYNVLDATAVTDQENPLIHLVVIDKITPLLGPNLSPVSPQGHAVMVHFMRYLREKARSRRYIVLVLNGASPITTSNHNSVFGATNREPSLGASFPFLTDVTLWLTAGKEVGFCDESTFVLETWRSKNVPSGTWNAFTICNGIVVSHGQYSRNSASVMSVSFWGAPGPFLRVPRSY